MRTKAEQPGKAACGAFHPAGSPGTHPRGARFRVVGERGLKDVLEDANDHPKNCHDRECAPRGWNVIGNGANDSRPWGATPTSSTGCRARTAICRSKPQCSVGGSRTIYL